MSDNVTLATNPSAPGLIAASAVRRSYCLSLSIFVALSLCMALLISQTVAIERGGWQNVVYIAGAVILPLFALKEIVRDLLGPNRLLLVLLVCAGSWQILVGDWRAATQLLLFVYVLSWVSTSYGLLSIRYLGGLYLTLVLMGVILKTFSDLNSYGLIPGRTIPEFGVWRVSFFPNVAYSGILSMALLLIFTQNVSLIRKHPFLIAIALYFMAFSFVRATFIAALMYLVLRILFGRWRRPRPKLMFWVALGLAFAFVVGTAMSANILYSLQEFPGVSTMLLRGETSLTVEQISYQLYRPWMWNEQWKLIVSSPWLMGWGSADFYGLVAQNIENPETKLISTGSESLPTRLVVVYGLPGMLFTGYLVSRLRDLARDDDRWACACFPPLFSLMMSWGGVFHPTEGLFAILMLIIARGAKGFDNGRRAATSIASDISK